MKKSKKITLGGFLYCTLSDDTKKLICKTCDGFDYYGKPSNERTVGAYTSVQIDTDAGISLIPGGSRSHWIDKENTILIFDVEYYNLFNACDSAGTSEPVPGTSYEPLVNAPSTKTKIHLFDHNAKTVNPTRIN